MTKSARSARVTIGWREWIELPDLTHLPIKAKVDSGARTSALHAQGLAVADVDGVPTATFSLLPHQRSSADAVVVEIPVERYSRVRSSNGKVETRPVIRTRARVGGIEWSIEVTLTSRPQMGFRMLLGRSALKRDFLVNPGRSFLASDTPPASRGVRQ